MSRLTDTSPLSKTRPNGNKTSGRVEFLRIASALAGNCRPDTRRRSLGLCAVQSLREVLLTLQRLKQFLCIKAMTCNFHSLQSSHGAKLIRCDLIWRLPDTAQVAKSRRSPRPAGFAPAEDLAMEWRKSLQQSGKLSCSLFVPGLRTLLLFQIDSIE